MKTEDHFSYPVFVKGDFDGFIGLFIDNLTNLLIITGLSLAIGMPSKLVFSKMLPGTAAAVLLGNLFYSWQAHRLAKKERRTDVTALPYGINTVSLFAFFSLIIAPIYSLSVANRARDVALSPPDEITGQKQARSVLRNAL